MALKRKVKRPSPSSEDSQRKLIESKLGGPVRAGRTIMSVRSANKDQAPTLTKDEILDQKVVEIMRAAEKHAEEERRRIEIQAVFLPF